VLSKKRYSSTRHRISDSYDIINIDKDVNMITGIQIRAARFGLRMSAQELGEAAGVSLPTIQRFEQVDGIPPSRSSTLLRVKSALEAAGVEFIGSLEDRPGIKFWLPPRPVR
jgi:DNA-binding transcriptional regulator YiaG